MQTLLMLLHGAGKGMKTALKLLSNVVLQAGAGSSKTLRGAGKGSGLCSRRRKQHVQSPGDGREGGPGKVTLGLSGGRHYVCLGRGEGFVRVTPGQGGGWLEGVGGKEGTSGGGPMNCLQEKNENVQQLLRKQKRHGEAVRVG